MQEDISFFLYRVYNISLEFTNMQCYIEEPPLILLVMNTQVSGESYVNGRHQTNGRQ